MPLLQILYYSITDTVFHLFCECARLAPLPAVLGRVLMKMWFMFTKTVFVFSCGYRLDGQERCMMANLLVGLP